MTTLSDARGASSLVDSYDGYIEQVQHVLHVHHVPFGTPFDFLILAQTLEHNSQLRNDLTVLLQSFMEGERKITHRTALGIIAVASGGADFTTSSHGISPQADGMSQPAGNGNQEVNVLVDLLMSVGGRTQTAPHNSRSRFDSTLDSRTANSNSKPVDNETLQAALLAPSSSDHEPDSKQFGGAHFDGPSALEAVTNPDSNLDLPSQDSPPQDSSPDSGTEDPLVESLTRLELNALQVKHYLDSIDQRISRIEPRLDSLPAYVPTPATPPQPVSESHLEYGYGHLSDGRYSAMLATETANHQAQDDLPPLDQPPTQTKILSDMRPLLNSSSRRKRSQRKFEVPIIIGAALVLLVLLYWGFNQNTQSPRIEPVNPTLAQNTTIPPSNPARATSINPSRPSENATTRPSASHIAAAEILPEVHHRPLRSSMPDDLNDTSYPSSAPTTDAEDSDDSTLTEPVTVSPGIMAANVLSAPQPSYPLFATLTRMRGEVIMKAIISKDGTIKTVHVVKGHRLLRGAATNAVRSWRYRPYLVNGRPVEVATTVSVDFDQSQ